MKLKLFFSAFICLLLAFTTNAQLTVSNTQTPTQLVQNVLLGAGVQVSNISYTGANTARGSFSCTGCGLGFTDGVLLTSGEIYVAPGPNGGTGAGVNVGFGGDPDLDVLVAPDPSQDACVLEFDFSVAADSVEFRYIFASEEYNDYVNSAFNDVFAFFISGPGFTGQQNIAIIPGTTTPVSINNVNNGNAGGGQNATGPCNNCAYFRDNANPATATINVEYDGLTTILTARAAVHPCEQYHIKLAVSDVQDHIFDSGVFLEANSFTSFGQVSIIPDTTQFDGRVSNDTVYICPGETAVLISPPAQNITWSTGDTTQSISVTQPGNYSMFIWLGTCFAWSNTITLVIDTPQAFITPAGPVTLPLGGTDTLCANLGLNYLWSTGETTQCIIVDTALIYTVSVTNFTVCTSSATVSVVDCNSGGSGTPGISINGTLHFCTGNATTISAIANNFSPISYHWSTGETTQSININTTGSYTATISGPCGIIVNSSVNITTGAPSVNISGNTVVCPGTNTALSANSATATNYLWSNGMTSSVVNVSVGSYTITVFDVNGCTSTDFIQVTPTSSPVPIIGGITAICSGFNTSLDAGIGYNSYLWSNGASNQILTTTSAGTYTVTVTDANGCTGSDSITVIVNANPAPSISGPADICIGDIASLSVSAGFSIYNWSNGSSSNAINVNTTGNYSVIVTDINGCTGSNQITLQVHSLPNPTISGVDIICNGSSTTFNAGGGYTDYLWSNGSTNQIVNINVAQIYTVTVTDAFSCSNSTNKELIVNQNPIPNITGVNAFCDGNSSVLNAGSGYSNYLWSVGTSVQNLSVSTAGNYTVTVTDLNGCTGAGSININVYSLPLPIINGPSDICVGDVATLDVGINFQSYVWSSGQNTSSINVSNSGLYTVLVTDINGCTGSSSFQLTSHNLPTPLITGPNIICDGTTASLDAGAGYAQYVWSNSSTNQIINLGITQSVSVTVTDNIGCVGTSPDHSLLVDIPIANIIALGPIEFCDSEEVILVANSGTSYLWSNGSTDSQIITNQSGSYVVNVTDSIGCIAKSTPVDVIAHFTPIVDITHVPIKICDRLSVSFINNSTYESSSVLNWDFGDGNNSSEKSPSHTYDSPGTYTVELTITGQFGCESSQSIIVVINRVPYPEAYFEMSTDMTPLFDSKVDFKDLSLNAKSWHWTFGDNVSSQLQNPTHYFDHEGIHTIRLIVENSVGCVDEFSREVFITPFFVPNAFSPNGDGKNDYYFSGNYTIDVRTFTMTIWDRWGNLIFETESLHIPWDGKHIDGNNSPEGVYVYMIEVTTHNEIKHLYKGSVTLIR